MTDICSLWSYDDIKKSGYLGEKQSRVLEIFTSNHPQSFTATEIVRMLGRGVSENVRNRITELEQMGFLKKTGHIRCTTTKRIVNLFQWTERKTPLPNRIEWVKCSICEGKGKVIKTVFHQPQEDYTRKDLFA